jgi:hypothetical protein
LPFSNKKAKPLCIQSGFAVHIPPGRLPPNITSGLGAWETLLGRAKFGVDFLGTAPYRPKNPSFVLGSVENRSLYEKHHLHSMALCTGAQAFLSTMDRSGSGNNGTLTNGRPVHNGQDRAGAGV